MSLLEEIAGQRDALLQTQSWKEPVGSDGQQHRNTYNVLWNGKVLVCQRMCPVRL